MSHVTPAASPLPPGVSDAPDVPDTPHMPKAFNVPGASDADAAVPASAAAFYDYVRGRTDAVPPGYTEAGLRVYRYLVYLGASQMIEAHYPELRQQLGEESWCTLIEAFVRESRWQSHFYEDLHDEFTQFLDRLNP